ncbi:hypothetical protein [Lyngbya aestuarii]|uniref:hypothetical protein n=1 Tax=Lyngbya aestuarii TaxID=118322 RepID=UPI00403D664F
MPSQTFIVRAHARTIHTKPVTFICAKCNQMTTRECYPGRAPKYCLSCSPRKKKSSETSKPEKGMFKATHYLVEGGSGEKTPICLEKSPEPGWHWVRTALDWFSGESIIQYHQQKGLQSRGIELSGYSLETFSDAGVETSEVTPVNKKKSQKVPQKSVAAVEASEVAIPVLEVTSTRSYTVKEVCHRFKCGDRILKRMRSSPDFGQWSQARDPEGLVWEYRQGKFFPSVAVKA